LKTEAYLELKQGFPCWIPIFPARPLNELKKINLSAQFGLSGYTIFSGNHFHFENHLLKTILI